MFDFAAWIVKASMRCFEAIPSFSAGGVRDAAVHRRRGCPVAAAGRRESAIDRQRGAKALGDVLVAHVVGLGGAPHRVGRIRPDLDNKGHAANQHLRIGHGTCCLTLGAQ